MAVGGYVDDLLGRAVRDAEHVLRRHHQCPSGEAGAMNWYDVALHSPRKHGAAVGEVVARRARGSGDHEPVAAHLAELLAKDRVLELRHAAAGPAVEGDVVHGQLVAHVGGRGERGQPEDLVATRERAPHAPVEVASLDGGQETRSPRS